MSLSRSLQLSLALVLVMSLLLTSWLLSHVVAVIAIFVYTITLIMSRIL